MLVFLLIISLTLNCIADLNATRPTITDFCKTNSGKKDAIKVWGKIPKSIRITVIETLVAFSKITDKTSELSVPCQDASADRLQHMIDRHQTTTNRKPNTGPRAQGRNNQFAAQVVDILSYSKDISNVILTRKVLDNPRADVWLNVRQLQSNQQLQSNEFLVRIAITLPKDIKVPIVCPVLDQKWKHLSADSFCLQFICQYGQLKFSSAYFQAWDTLERECVCGCNNTSGHMIEGCIPLPEYAAVAYRI